MVCKDNPGVCNDGCVCCVYGNGNSRCRPAGTCGPGTVTCPAGEIACAGDCLQCAAPANATPVCCDGACDYACNAGYEQCGVSCFNSAGFPFVVNIPANLEALTDTGFFLQAGDSVIVSVTGMIDIDGAAALGSNGPNGNPNVVNCIGPILCGAAVGAIGGGARFLIGAGPTVVTASESGNLFLGIQDNAGEYSNNTGGFAYSVACNSTATGCAGG